MKKTFKILILIFCFIPLIIKAEDYNTSVNIAKNHLYSKTYKDTYQHYIFSNLYYNGGSVRINGGLLSYDEFLITTNNKGHYYSYLFDGYDYWTYTLKNSKRVVISSSEKLLIDEIETPSTRVVVNSKANNLVMGNGTRNNPWIFVKVPRIKIKSNEYGKISTNNCTDMVSELDIQYTGNEIELCIKPNVGYTYISNTCEDIIKYTNGSLKIEDVNLDTSCEVDFGRTTYEVVLDQSNTTTNSEPTKIYLLYSNGWYENKIGTNSLTKVTPPTRSGYKFDGYYTGENKTGEKVIDASGKIISGKTKVFNKSSILYPGWSSITYTINYYIGNMESGSVKLGSSTCEYDKSCTLTSFATLGGVFPYSAEDKEKNGKTNYAWSMYGWGNTQSTTTVLYTNSQTFTYKTVGNINLYAIGRKNFYFNTGVSPTSSFNTQRQYWNPYTTSNLTTINIPTPTNISSWTFVGYLGGSNTASASVTYDSSNVGKVVTPAYNTWGTMRSVYKRGLTIKYNANGGSGSVSNTTGTQYYNSGYGSASANTGANITSWTTTLSNNSFTKAGNTFSKWADGSTSGTQYAQGASYTFSPAVNNTTISKDMYAIWNINKLTLIYNTDTSATISSPVTSGTNTYYWKINSDGNIQRSTDNSIYTSNFFVKNYGSNVDLVNYNYSSYVNLSNSGYKVVTGKEWCTEKNGGGICYNQTSEYDITSFCPNIETSSCTKTLYLNWTEDKITYNLVSKNYSCANDSVGTNPYITYTGNCKIIDDGNDNWRIKLLTSGTLTFKMNSTIDVFLVGGGGAGSTYNYYYASGGGGGGGYTTTQKGISVSKNTAYSIVVGAGGTPSASAKASTAFGYTANPGANATSCTGGKGGSGGASGGPFGGSTGGSNGTTGSGGGTYYASCAGGTGSGSTTCEFGEQVSGSTNCLCPSSTWTDCLYSGGGGGGGYYHPTTGNYDEGHPGGAGGAGDGVRATTKSTMHGKANTGGGGGGANSVSGGNGGSGVVVIRNKR